MDNFLEWEFQGLKEDFDMHYTCTISGSRLYTYMDTVILKAARRKVYSSDLERERDRYKTIDRRGESYIRNISQNNQPFSLPIMANLRNYTF